MDETEGFLRASFHLFHASMIARCFLAPMCSVNVFSPLNLRLQYLQKYNLFFVHSVFHRHCCFPSASSPFPIDLFSVSTVSIILSNIISFISATSAVVVEDREVFLRASFHLFNAAWTTRCLLASR
ncbi:hypothetical protein QJS10_CPA05g02228 [Acorus calamus]|uniref:Uncharacterized protein n=1 Tax=Acorus calamus TaxID=4465 RepID=A0AAV9EV38_ACOCL|nr:hypothetical protein QJS10_CPA05g02228 [Acorus calamus]